MRLAFTYIPNGVTMKEWKPAATGADFEFTRILKPLEPFRQDLYVLSGLDCRNGNSLGDGGGDHARAGACLSNRRASEEDLRGRHSSGYLRRSVCGEAKSVMRLGCHPLELGCEDSRTVGNCDTGYSCAYTNSISWRGPSTPLPPETNPRIVFERLFGTEDLSLDPADARAPNVLRKSILDVVGDRTQTLVGTLGAADKRKIDEYLTSIRELEKRIEMAEKDNRDFTPDIEKPAGIPPTASAYIKLMFDLQILAFQADLTRVSTLMLGREGSVRTYPEIGINDPHHPLTHHRNLPEMIEKVTRINCHHAELFAYYVGKLKSTTDGDGTLLDNSMIVYGSGINDGNSHSHEDLPLVLAGRGRIFEAGTPHPVPQGYADDESLPVTAGADGRASRKDRR